MLDFEVYFDDSGTHRQSEVAVGACYIAPKGQWDLFVKDLDLLRAKHGFDCFHMADFMAGQQEFAGWDESKRERVLRAVSCLIKTRSTLGISCSLPKKAWDQYMPDRYKKIIGERHYTFAVRSVMGVIEQWRKKFGHKRPMQYVFDRMSQGKGEIMSVMDIVKKFPKEGLEKYGAVKDVYSFQDKKAFKPLQAADIRAWESYNYMRTVVMPQSFGPGTVVPLNAPSAGTPNLQYLRKHPSLLTVAWLTDVQVKKMADQMTDYEARTGKLPFWTEGASPVSEEGAGMI